MGNLLRKEFVLALHPTNIIFLFLAFLVFIPNYPYYVAPFFTILGIQFLCVNGRENGDIPFTLTLPASKRDVVAARILTAVILEAGQLLLMVPCYLIKDLLPIPDNVVGMEANAAMLGVSLALLGVFNLIFFPRYYRDTSKVGGPFVLGMSAYWVLLLIAEALTHFLPLFRDRLDTRGGLFLTEKLAVLVAGAALFSLFTSLAARISAARFERLDQ